MSTAPFRRSPSPATASVIGRRRAFEVARHDPAEARRIARQIPDAWYRVQALAYVAEAAPNERMLLSVGKGVRPLPRCYGTVAVMAWPIAVALRRGARAFAERERERCLELAPIVEPHNSQAYALEMLWTACHMADPAFARPIWDRARALCQPDRCRRAARLWRHVAEALEERRPGAGEFDHPGHAGRQGAPPAGAEVLASIAG